MPKFKKFTGNYSQMVKALGLPEDYVKISASRDFYDYEVEKDIHRVCYVSFQDNISHIKSRLQDTSHLKDNELSYTQGNFYAGIFAETVVKTHPRFMEVTILASQEGTLADYSKHLGFNYTDDEGNLCGVAISYLRDDKDPQKVPADQILPVDQRKRPFTIAIIKNVNKPVNQREVTLIGHTDLLEDAIARKGYNLEASNLLQEVNQALNSKSVSQLLKGVFNDDSINMDVFNPLKKRIVPDHNIDNRDPKLAKLFDLFVWQVRLLSLPGVKGKQVEVAEALGNVLQQAYTDVNFFKDKSLNDIDDIVNDFAQNPYIAALPPLKNHLAVKEELMKIVNQYNVASLSIRTQLDREANQSVFSRNLGNFLLIGFAVLAVVAISLTLSGVFAPLGLTLGAGLATVFAITGICTASAIALERTAKVVDHESEIQTYVIERDNKQRSSRPELQELDEQYELDIYETLDEAELNPLHAQAEEDVDEPEVERPVRRRSASHPHISVGQTDQTMFGRRRSLSDLGREVSNLGKAEDVVDDHQTDITFKK